MQDVSSKKASELPQGVKTDIRAGSGAGEFDGPPFLSSPVIPLCSTA